ncbi:MAG: mitofilin family membrane protein, partial [Pseudomonadota bacterium]
LDRLTDGAASLAPLRNAAREGVPTFASLKNGFEPVVLRALAATGADAKGIVGRMQSLVSVRPATPQSGSRPQDIISRADAKLENDDLGGAVAELEALEGESAEAFADWMAQAQQRLAATDAIEELNAALLDQYQN